MITETLDAFFYDFGETCTVNGVSAVGIFDKAYQAEFGVVDSNIPILLVADSAVGSAVVGSSVVIRSVTYTIAGIQPDGTGLTILALK